jgi:molecular chaperone Hsp33
MNGHDRLIQGMTAGGDFRILAAQTTNCVIEARNRLDLSPTAATALGRALTGAVLLARLLDKHYRRQRVTLRFEGGGPLGVVFAEGNVAGEMRGTVGDPQYDDDSVNVGAALGTAGMLTVVRAVPPDGRPYTSQVALENGEIATDLTRYLADSEQIHSAVLLGVLTKPTGIASAGGLIIQAFPHATEASIAKMEETIRKAPALSRLLGEMPIEDAVRAILSDVGYKQIDHSFDVPLQYHCNCTRERAFAPLQLFDRSELDQMIEQGGAEVVCQYCGQRYFFSKEDLNTVPKHADA